MIKCVRASRKHWHVTGRAFVQACDIIVDSNASSSIEIVVVEAAAR
jgi:hypothetical protein